MVLTMDQDVGQYSAADIHSVAMSANVASAVCSGCQQLNHFIRISSHDLNCASAAAGPQHEAHTATDGINLESSDCSYNLLSENYIVLSQWDDIVGPQTLHIWLHKHCCNLSDVLKVVNYVTCHTVNCTSVSSASNSSVSFLIVPDLNVVSISHSYYCDSSSKPYSLALIANINKYNFLQQRLPVLQRWLKKLFMHFSPFLDGWQSNVSEKRVQEISKWILDFDEAIISLDQATLENCSLETSDNILKHPNLPLVVTSHLQTFGCSVIIGTTSSVVNNFIKFLGLFLDKEDVTNSCLLLQSGHSRFLGGLQLQGVLMNAFGYREISSLEIASNQWPVTVIDLTRSMEEGGVKQSPQYHLHAFLNLQPELNCGDSFTRSLLNPVKISSKLVIALMKEMQMLPIAKWTKHVSRFKQKIKSLAQLLVNLVHKYGETYSSDSKKVYALQQFKKLFHITEADFVIILAQAEKLKPGIFYYVMQNAGAM